jgi:hypothetical protein
LVAVCRWPPRQPAPLVATGARLNPGNGGEGEGPTDDIATQTCRSKTIISTHTLIRSHRLHLPSATGIAAERQALPTVSTLYMELREAPNYVDQAVGAPCAPQLGIASVEISITLAAQRSDSAAQPAAARPHCPRHGRGYDKIIVLPFSDGIKKELARKGAASTQPAKGRSGDRDWTRGKVLCHNKAESEVQPCANSSTGTTASCSQSIHQLPSLQ